MMPVSLTANLIVVRLADLPAEWSRQRQMLGLPPFEPSLC
jgi:hypothetical protein